MLNIDYDMVTRRGFAFPNSVFSKYISKNFRVCRICNNESNHSISDRVLGHS